MVDGVTPPQGYDGLVTIDMDQFDQVLEMDETSRAARIQAGVFGPALEDQLRPHGFTLRHFPQSFTGSTLGGWIATRSGGHYATKDTHIDDFVESVRMLTPVGWWELRRLPESGAGPSPDRLVIGSEGILGVITEAWMRIQVRPRYRATAGVAFPSWEAGYEATRQIVQAISEALKKVCGGGTVNCRFTHVYTDGPAPYYTYSGLYKPGMGSEEQAAIKRAASDAIMEAGGTITHHHAIGRQHRPWYDQQRPEPFAMALRAAKLAVDPNGVLNPGVLIDH